MESFECTPDSRILVCIGCGEMPSARSRFSYNLQPRVGKASLECPRCSKSVEAAEQGPWHNSGLPMAVVWGWNSQQQPKNSVETGKETTMRMADVEQMTLKELIAEVDELTKLLESADATPAQCRRLVELQKAVIYIETVKSGKAWKI